MAKVTFLGLGVMGFPMAGHLAAKGHEVTIWNRSPAKAVTWIERHKGHHAATIQTAVKGAEFVMACVGNDDDLREVCLGPEGAFSAMEKDALFIDHTTVSAEISRELAAIAHTRGFAFLDAPVSGGQAGAENGTLSIMCGGEAADFARAEPILACYGRICKLIGPSGAGQLAKMMNQICIGGMVQALSEAMAFGMRAGLDAKAVVEVISQGAAGSWQMSNRATTMIDDEYDFGFAVDWMRKDFKICLETADKIGASLPVTALVDQFYKDVQMLGGGRQDTSSLIRRLPR